MVEFGEQLRRAREAKGMTQQSLAEQLYVTRQSVSRWECGDRYPDLLTTKKISQILEVSLDDLLSGKEMTKVVERNPVVENKLVNNIMIVLYAAVVLTYLMVGINTAISVQFSDGNTQGVLLRFFEIAISITAFMYGLVNALSEALSPKRMGIVLVAYYLAACLVNIYTCIAFKTWTITVSLGLMDMLPCVVGAIAGYFFFMRGQNKKLWFFIISAVSVLGVCYSVRLLYFLTTMPKQYNLPMVENLLTFEHKSVNSLLSIAIDVLILYQTYTLYKKRIAVSEIAKNHFSQQ